MNVNNLPTTGKYYGSGEVITELNEMIDNTIYCTGGRCDCDSNTRCFYCRMESEFAFKREELKKKIQVFIDMIELKMFKQN